MAGLALPEAGPVQSQQLKLQADSGLAHEGLKLLAGNGLDNACPHITATGFDRQLVDDQADCFGGEFLQLYASPGHLGFGSGFGLDDQKDLAYGIDQQFGIGAGRVEEIAWRNGFMDTQLHKLAQPLAKNGYGQYLLRLLAERQRHEP